MNKLDALRERATDLGLHGIVAHWNDIAAADWVERAIEWEEQERAQRSLERRLVNARLKSFKPLCDFDWSWPQSCDRAAFESLMTLEFIKEAANVVVVGPNGVGKTTLVSNIAYQAAVQGYTVLFTTASKMLGDLAALDSDTALRSRFQYYARPSLLCVDEVGSLSYSNRHADLLFEIVSRRYEKKSTIITTNKEFSGWSEFFPNAASVVAMIDRLVHHADILEIQGDSYRAKESQERNARRANKRKTKS